MSKKYPTTQELYDKLLDAGIMDWHRSDSDEGYVSLTFYVDDEDDSDE